MLCECLGFCGAKILKSISISKTIRFGWIVMAAHMHILKVHSTRSLQSIRTLTSRRHNAFSNVRRNEFDVWATSDVCQCVGNESNQDQSRPIWIERLAKKKTMSICSSGQSASKSICLHHVTRVMNDL